MTAISTTRSISPTSTNSSPEDTPRSGSGRISPPSGKKEGALIKPGQHVQLTYKKTVESIEIIFIQRILEPATLRGYLPGNLTQSKDFLLKGAKVTPLDKHTVIPLSATCVIL